ncbi:MAG: hypothetical protein ACE149_17610 [Armatimonadota bacterium]
MSGATRYPPILKAYEEYLAARVSRGEIEEQSKNTRLRRANRLFEACLRELSAAELERIHAKWFDEHGAVTMIGELKALLADRPRCCLRG